MPKDPVTFPFFVFGNKKDKADERQVPKQRIDEWLQKNNDLPYDETSALDGSNIEAAFNKIASSLLNKALKDATTYGMPATIGGGAS
mmetsp:Transcript_19042/g.26426  ORF Transcript_19042/g.26426 Transcript_19042/m.26426 type:complete len:87 (-) Transcript_19042:156-416(-)